MFSFVHCHFEENCYIPETNDHMNMIMNELDYVTVIYNVHLYMSSLMLSYINANSMEEHSM